MTFLVMMMLTILVFRAESLDLDNQQFLIYNKKYHRARIAQWGRRHRNVGTYQHGLRFGQLWTMKSDPNKKGCYYIHNYKYSRYRLADYRGKLLTYPKSYFDDQLFKFVPNGKGYYRIFSCYYPTHRLRKWGAQDYKTSFSRRAGGSEQLWKLVPRYTATLYSKVVFKLDNRQNTKDVHKVITTTVGLTRTSKRRISHKTNFKLGLSTIIKKLTVSPEITHTMDIVKENIRVKKWQKVVKETYTISAGTNFMLVQQVAELKSVMNKDDVKLFSYAKVFQSKAAYFRDPDNFIIPKKN